jgi:myo-inositol-1(or 4)-monophosphatase
LRDELFSATQGSGAQLNHRRIRTHNITQFKQAIIASALPAAKNKQLLPKQLAALGQVSQQCHNLRFTGSAALDLAYVASGRFNGYWEAGLNAWDIAAGVLMVKEAGGYVTDFSGQDDYLTKGEILAAPPRVYPKLFKYIKELAQPSS